MDVVAGDSGDYFYCGVVEGFYGKPWTLDQRTDLFIKLKKWRMNSYLYAPKNDTKHRAYWRQLYNEEESTNLKALISAAKENEIQFIYAISPGRDITYSSSDDREALKNKLKQVLELGCEAFAVLFDDIEPEMSKGDQQVFQSFAHAQAAVTNEAYQNFGSSSFLFCPTEYCATRAIPNVPTSQYLRSLGSELHPKIDIMWTGPKVISQEISVDSIKELGAVLQRRPVIWDNIHANDYDKQRLFLGPFYGRSTQLIQHLRGVLTNPNCQYGANFVAIHTLATWSRCTEDAPEEILPTTDSLSIQLKDEKMEVEKSSIIKNTVSDDSFGANVYHPKTALRLAVEEWLPEFKKLNPYLLLVDPNEHVPDTVNGASEGQLNPEELTLKDLQLLCDLYYLPYQYGPQGLHSLVEFQWLKSNGSLVFGIPDSDKLKSEVKEWYDRAKRFELFAEDVTEMSNRLSDMPNRDLVNELYPFAWDIRISINQLKSYISWLGSSDGWTDPFKSGDQESWVVRGGIGGDFERLVPTERRMDASSNNSFTVSLNQTYTIRPYRCSDERQVYKLCLMTFKDGLSAANEFKLCPNLPGEITFGGYLNHGMSFVVEDNSDTIVGVGVAMLNAQEFRQGAYKEIRTTLKGKYVGNANECGDNQMVKDVIAKLQCDQFVLPPEIKSFPAELKCVVVIPLMDRTVPKRLMDCILTELHTKGANGCFIEITKAEQHFRKLFQTLGFSETHDNYLTKEL